MTDIMHWHTTNEQDAESDRVEPYVVIAKKLQKAKRKPTDVGFFNKNKFLQVPISLRNQCY